MFLLTQFLSCSLTKLCLQLGNDAFYLTKLPSIKCKWTATWYQNFSKILSLDREKIAVIFPPFDAYKRQLDIVMVKCQSKQSHYQWLHLTQKIFINTCPVKKHAILTCFDITGHHWHLQSCMLFNYQHVFHLIFFITS